MPGSIQHTLQQMSIAPPPSAWEKIAARLDEEFVATDAAIADRLEHAYIAPPPGAWNRLAEELDVPAVNEPSKVIPVLYRSIAIAALIAGIAIVAYLYIFSSNTKPVINESQLATTTPDNKRDVTPAIEEERPQPRKTSIEPPARPIAAQQRSRRNAVPNEKSAEQQIIADESTMALVHDPEQAPLYELTTVSALQPVSVSAPPLLDKTGNIILDATLIGNPEDEYITVTGPNGKQTKLSNKFLSCLGYINSGESSSMMDARALRCKAQFEEWRNRLLSQPAFIPTANNFFDIFEMKDMLQEM